MILKSSFVIMFLIRVNQTQPWLVVFGLTDLSENISAYIEREIIGERKMSKQLNPHLLQAQ